MRKYSFIFILSLFILQLNAQDQTINGTTFKQDGKVGIGTTNPTEKLHVNGTTTITADIGAVTSSHWQTGSHTLELQNSDAGDLVLSFHRAGYSNASIKHSSLGGLIFSGSGAYNQNHLFLKNNGYLGIGTTTPTSHFSAGTLINLKSTNNSEIVLDHSDGGITSDIGILSFERNNDHLAHIRAKHDGSTDSAFLSFHTQTIGGAFSSINSNEQMRITSNGNVGIGKKSPNAKLDVNGDIMFLNKVGFNTFDDFDVLGNSVAHYGMSRVSGSGYHNVALSGYFGLNFYTSGTERLRVLQNGNVGIGTTDTKGFKLGVDGKIAATEVKIATYANWSDFVFENTYNLPTLKEVERHINKNGHLKDIPSAEDVKKDGFFLGEMDSKLLQKIEELTLYTIEQQKKIDELSSIKKDNELLRKKFDALEALVSEIIKKQ